MKTLNRRVLVLLGAMLFLPAVASAAADMYLKLGGVKGESKIVTCTNGVCVIEGLAPGTYSVAVCDASGVVIPSDVEFECTVKSPRDSASGQATGKRQHSPIRISKSPGATASNQLIVADAGAQMTLRVKGGSGAPARAQDHNSSRSNKSSN